MCQLHYSLLGKYPGYSTDRGCPVTRAQGHSRIAGARATCPHLANGACPENFHEQSATPPAPGVSTGLEGLAWSLILVQGRSCVSTIRANCSAEVGQAFSTQASPPSWHASLHDAPDRASAHNTARGAGGGVGVGGTGADMESKKSSV